MLDLEEGLESRCRLSSGGGRGCGALHREISLIVRLCDPPRKQDRLLLCTAAAHHREEMRSSSTRWRVVLFVREMPTCHVSPILKLIEIGMQAWKAWSVLQCLECVAMSQK